MADWYMENYNIITIILAVLCAVMLFFAIRATSSHNKKYRREEAQIMRLKAIKEKFENMSAEVINNAESDELLEGVALFYQLRIQKSENIEKAFSDLPLCARYVYTLDIFSSEGGVASEFYANNGNILRELFIPALNAIGEKELAKAAAPLARMYDPKDEMSSIDSTVIAKADEKFSGIYDVKSFKLKAADYIRSEAESFI